MKREDSPHLRSRRDFLRQAACAAVGTVALTNAIRDLRIISSAAAQTPLDDYKALVCIFLSGGNDSNNLIIPTAPTEYSNYLGIRQNLALPQSAVLPIAPLNSDGRSYGLHPRCTELQTLFGEEKMALLFNTGPLLYPTTRNQYRSRSVALPPQLFSHSDQVTHWQTSLPDQPPKSGWGGRIADLMHPLQYELVNGAPTASSAKIALCTSVAGANTFEVGNVVQQYHVSTGGAVTVSGVTGARLQAMKDILALPDANLQRTAYADVVERAIATGDLLNLAIQGTSATSYWNVPFPTSSLGNQLKMIARLIQARSSLGMKRQIFFASVGGYDTHTSQVGNNAAPSDTTVGSHANLLAEVSAAVFAFQRATEQMQIADKVTAFTASDFGRTFPTNGQGSDHGWGSHHMIIGGAVRGRRIYGTYPVLQVNGPDDTSTGRWIPTVSVDEYSATLAKWFGVTRTYMSTVFPNLSRFGSPDLGFMNAAA
jgi:uncharacterized protein (DUF1501 family)